MGSSKARQKPTFVASGFFALRTPLLPFDEFLAWSEGLEASASVNDPVRLEEALAADRSRLRTRLQAVLELPSLQ